MHKTTAAGLTALALSAGLVVGVAPASAQTLPECEGVGSLSYPVGIAGTSSVSDSAPVIGSTIVASSGTGVFDAGSTVLASFLTGPVDAGRVTVTDDGEARGSFIVPSELKTGLHVLQLSGSRAGESRLVGFCLNVSEPVVEDEALTSGTGGPAPVAGATPPRTSSTPRISLPFTGSAELTTVAAVAAGLLAVGGASVVVGRRRKADGSPA